MIPIKGHMTKIADIDKALDKKLDKPRGDKVLLIIVNREGPVAKTP